MLVSVEVFGGSELTLTASVLLGTSLFGTSKLILLASTFSELSGMSKLILFASVVFGVLPNINPLLESIFGVFKSVFVVPKSVFVAPKVNVLLVEVKPVLDVVLGVWFDSEEVNNDFETGVLGSSLDFFAGTTSSSSSMTIMSSFLAGCTPKVNPVEAGVCFSVFSVAWKVMEAFVSVETTPNLNPTEPEPEPVELTLSSPKLNCGVLDVVPKLNFWAPGLDVPQLVQEVASSGFLTRQVVHSHLWFCFLMRSPNPEEPLLSGGIINVGFESVFKPGLGVSHATHLTAPDLFLIIQIPHSQVSLAGLNLSPNPEVIGGVLNGFAPGFGVVQATQLVAFTSFRTIQAPHSHLSADILNWLAKPLFSTFLGSLSVSQATQRVAVGIFRTIQLPHSHVPDAGLNLAIRSSLGSGFPRISITLPETSFEAVISVF